MCDYGAACNRKGCVYRHPAKGEVPKTEQVCMPYLAGFCQYGNRCRNLHPPDDECEAKRLHCSMTWCEWGAACRTQGCLFRHPTLHAGQAPMQTLPFDLQLCAPVPACAWRDDTAGDGDWDVCVEIDAAPPETSSPEAAAAREDHYRHTRMQTGHEACQPAGAHSMLDASAADTALGYGADAVALGEAVSCGCPFANAGVRAPLEARPVESSPTANELALASLKLCDAPAASLTAAPTGHTQPAIGTQGTNHTKLKASAKEFIPGLEVAQAHYASCHAPAASYAATAAAASSCPCAAARPATANTSKPRAVTIPQELWLADVSRTQDAFAIADALERFAAVNEPYALRRQHAEGERVPLSVSAPLERRTGQPPPSAGVLDMHFQSTKTASYVLDEVLPRALVEYVEVWVITGTGHHTDTRSHQKSVGGGVLHAAVEAYLVSHNYRYHLGKDRRGHSGAFLVLR